MKNWLAAHASQLRELWLALDWPTPSCVIHGDAGPGNTMGTATGTFLIDWERLSIGHREWDQATAAWHRDLFVSLGCSLICWRRLKKAGS
ncbi:phosphotransferase family protein [Streptomyces sp. NPDC004376]